MKTRGYLMIMALAALSLTGCRKDLCYNHDEHGLSVRTNVTARWEDEWERNAGKNWEDRWQSKLGFSYDELRPEAGEGIRARVFTDGVLENEANLESTGGRLQMSPGVHDILFYNNDTEFITFEYEDETASAMASTRTRTRATFTPRNGEETVNAPDQLYGSFHPNYSAERTDSVTAMPINMRPLAYTYVIHYKFKHGLKYVAIARGALSGMAKGVYLQTGITSEEAATILFDDCIVDQDLGVYTTILSFGLPGTEPLPDGAHDEHGHSCILNLEVTLKNGNTVEFNYDVTAQVCLQPRGGVIVIEDIEISDEEGLEGGSGFDPDVDGWGDSEDIVLPLD